MKTTRPLIVLAVLPFCACALRATLPPKVGEARVILWDGADMEGAGAGKVELQPRTPVTVTSTKEGCHVAVKGPVSAEGKVSCSDLGTFVMRPTPLYVKPGKDVVRMILNGGVLVAPKERKGDWVQVAGDALGVFKGWIRSDALGATVQKSWLAPGLPNYPWRCGDGTWMYSKPGGVFLMWVPGPWCRVTLLSEQKQWSKVEYLDSKIKVVGWVEAGSLRPDREPRFHPGARATVMAAETPVFAEPTSKKPFANVRKGVRIWASLNSKGRTLVQTQAEPIEVVGWVAAQAVSPAPPAATAAPARPAGGASTPAAAPTPAPPPTKAPAGSGG